MAVAGSTSFNQPPRPVAAVAWSGPAGQRSSFLAQLLAVEAPRQGIELDNTAASLALYSAASRTAPARWDGVDLIV